MEHRGWCREPEFDQDSILEIGQLTADQTRAMLAAIPDGDKDNKYAETAIQRAIVSIVFFNSMIGIIKRKATSMLSFSPKYIHLKDVYEVVSDNESVTSSFVIEQLLSLLSS